MSCEFGLEPTLPNSVNASSINSLNRCLIRDGPASLRADDVDLAGLDGFDAVRQRCKLYKHLKSVNGGVYSV